MSTGDVPPTVEDLTWNVRGLTMPEVLVPDVPVVVTEVLLVIAEVRVKVGTLKAGAAKSVVGFRLTAPGIRSAQMLKSAAARVWALALNPVVVPVPVVAPLELEPRVAVPPIVRLEPKSKIGPPGFGMTPVGVSTGDVEGVAVKGKE